VGTVLVSALALGAVALCAALLLWRSRRVRRRDIAFVASLQARGFRPPTPAELATLGDLPLAALRDAAVGRSGLVMRGTDKGVPVLVFDLGNGDREAGRRAGATHGERGHRTCVLMKVESVGAGDLVIVHGDPPGWPGPDDAGRLPEVLRDGSLRVRCDVPKLAARVVGPAMRSYLASLSPLFDFELRGGFALCFARRLNPAALPMQIEALAGFVARLPGQR